MSDNLLSRGLNRFGYEIELTKDTPFLTDPTDPKLPSIRIWLVAVLGITLCLTLMTTKSEVHRPDSGDAREYLELAYNIYHHGVFADRAAEMSPQPTLGREPGYAMFLAGLLLVDSKFRKLTVYCLKSQAGCPIENYTLPVWTNRALVAIVGLLVLWITARLTGSWPAGTVAGFAIWLNTRMYKDLNYIISEAFALFLITLFLLLLYEAWRQRSLTAWFGAGLVFAVLTLTKTVFLYLAYLSLPLFILFVLGKLVRSTRTHLMYLFLAALLFGSAFSVPVGTWMHRNAQLSGIYALTDLGRAALNLKSREIYNDFSATQYVAAFVHWTRGFGDNLARELFEPEIWKPFELDNPQGFYLTSVDDVVRRLSAAIQEHDASRAQAAAIVVDELIAEILSRPIIHSFTTIPVVYRGVWVDNFAWFSVPLFIVTIWHGLRRRRWDLLLILAPSMFSLVFYSLISFNLPRYQTVAVPGLSITLAIGAEFLFRKLKFRRLGHGDRPKT